MKPVHAYVELDDFDTPKNWYVEGIAQLGYTRECSLSDTTYHGKGV